MVPSFCLEQKRKISCVKESYRHIKFSCQCVVVVLNSINIQSVQSLHWNVKILLPFNTFCIISLSYKVKGHITDFVVIAIALSIMGANLSR